MLFAISDPVWLAIVGIAAMAVKEYFDDLRARRAAAKVKEVAVQLETVHKATNSIVQQLVSSAEEKGNLQGRIDERADPQNHNKDAQQPIQPSLANKSRKDV